MSENYRITVIEDEAVPLAVSPTGNLSMAQVIFIMVLLAVMAGAFCIFLYRYLERCRSLRLRLEALNGGFGPETPASFGADSKRIYTVPENRYHLRRLSEAVAVKEQEEAERILSRMDR